MGQARHSRWAYPLLTFLHQAHPLEGHRGASRLDTYVRSSHLSTLVQASLKSRIVAGNVGESMSGFPDFAGTRERALSVTQRKVRQENPVLPSSSDCTTDL